MQEEKTEEPFFSYDLMNKKVQNSNYSEKSAAPSDSQGLSFLFCPPQSAHLNSLCLTRGRKEGKYFFPSGVKLFLCLNPGNPCRPPMRCPPNYYREFFGNLCTSQTLTRTQYVSFLKEQVPKNFTLEKLRLWENKNFLTDYIC